MDDLVERARRYATQAHRRIDQRRKYTNQPYDAHLKAVVDILRTATDDREMLAAAWLHDTLEDTPATYEDIEHEFGTEVADLVAELTDVSRAGDGNRAVRKAIDRDNLSRASARAKTIKLADLIDNTTDIVKHDPRFARVFVAEAAALLDVLSDGDARLFKRADKLVARSAEALKLDLQLDALSTPDLDDIAPTPEPSVFKPRIARLFADYFRANDIAEPLRSFDATHDPRSVARVLEESKLPVAGIRRDGVMAGYVLRSDFDSPSESRPLRGFTRDHIVDGDASLTEVIHVLTRFNHCFVTLLGEVVGVISRSEMQKPVVRMWLFGIVSLIEVEITHQVRKLWPNEAWRDVLTQRRLDNALALQQERQRRGMDSELLDCLQLTDKTQILFENEQMLAALGFRSKRSAKQVLREMESLRNHLAHAQDIVTYDWAQIVRLAKRIEELAGTSA